jgi:hypothetical protein
LTGASSIGSRPAPLGVWRVHSELLRACLVPLFVVLCYRFDWAAWRTFTCDAFLVVAHWIGIPAARLGPVSFALDGHVYGFVIACTALDAFFGSIPLLWRSDKSILTNLLFFAACFGVLSTANLARLEAGFVLFLRGVPWSLAHEAMAGVFYFALFLWIARRRGWSIRP